MTAPRSPRALWVSLTEEQASTLHPADLAEPLLEHLAATRQAHQVIVTNLLLPDTWSGFRGRRDEIARNVGEAATWLFAHGLLVFGSVGIGLNLLPLRLSSEAERLVAGRGFAAYRDRHAPTSDLLHPTIGRESYGLLLRGGDSLAPAVFDAFRRFEVAVREKAALPADLLGEKLMRAAFAPRTGPIRNPAAATESEQTAEGNLFAGAIGCFKNPTSHREVETDPQSALRALVLASQLLAIVEGRERRAPDRSAP